MTFVLKERAEDLRENVRRRERDEPWEGSLLRNDELVFLLDLHLASLHYAELGVPADYACSSCGATGCKLWREYSTFGPIALWCVECACKSQGKDASKVDRYGRIGDSDVESLADDHRTDSIGWRVPAVPTVEGDAYWGYTSVPQPGVNWWKLLPTRPPVTVVNRDPRETCPQCQHERSGCQIHDAD